jgi:hypothetical protein
VCLNGGHFELVIIEALDDFNFFQKILLYPLENHFNLVRSQGWIVFFKASSTSISLSFLGCSPLGFPNESIELPSIVISSE